MGKVRIFIDGEEKPVTVDFGNGPTDQNAIRQMLSRKYKPNTSTVIEREGEKTRKALKELSIAISGIEVNPIVNVQPPNIEVKAPPVEIPRIELPEINIPAPIVNITAPKSTAKKLHITLHSAKYNRRGDIDGCEMEIEING